MGKTGLWAFGMEDTGYVEYAGGRRTNLKQLGTAIVVGFEGQLHVALVIRVVLVISRVMHLEEFSQRKQRVAGFVFFEMGE
jgi:hypothetical protein